MSTLVGQPPAARRPLPAPLSASGRALRSAVTSLVAVALSVGAHSLSCGHLPPLALAASGAIALAWIVWCWSDRALGPCFLAATVLGSQLVLHGAFALADSGALSHSGHAGGSENLLPTGWAGVAHLAAALVVALWLRVGEKWLWQAAAAVAQAVHQVFGRPGLASLRLRPIAPRVPSGLGFARVLSSLRHAISHRGPPALVC